jgi:hypothetical protein
MLKGATWHAQQTPSPLRSGGEGRGEEGLIIGRELANYPSPQPSLRASPWGEGATFGAANGFALSFI